MKNSTYEFPVIIQVQGLLLATLPDDEEALSFVKEKATYPRSDFGSEEGHAVSIEELSPPEEEQEPRRRFRRREVDGKRVLCVDEHMVQGLIRESINRGGFSGFPRGFVRGLFTRPRIIPLVNPAGEPCTEADLKVEVRCFSGMTMQGPRNIRCEHEALLNPSLSFRLIILPGANETSKKAQYDVPAMAERLKDVIAFASEFGGLGAGKRKSGLKYDYGIFEVEFPSMVR